ncbi:hypothetical protein SAMN04487947_4033 [Halogeometricum rufum]|uniref:Polysaccharide lyase 14 domain-containing protein n=1 Tax=Halogeometricum rufum TaxID=553469 RepID=A0A1I6J5S8_9EURY|nr:hypothetical protein [Halogeometricum rufum]SFR73870.1 hypothetical protein SAMN04487947_4033 [Halogeometricum rufum]
MTSNHEYETPDEGTVDWHLPLNQNFDSIDTDVEVRDVESNLDAYTPSAGAKFLATDTGVRYLGDGQAWVKAPSQPMDRVVAPSRTTDPSDVSEGQMWYREDTDELRAKVGGEIVALASPQPEGSDVEPIWTMDFDDPAPEASKDFSDRNLSKLRSELEERGWDDRVNYHVDHGMYYTDEHVKSGSHAFAFYFMEDERMGCDLRKSVNRDEAWAQYYLKFEENFDCNDQDHADWDTSGGKIPGWMGQEVVSRPWRALGTFHNPGRYGYENSLHPGDPVQLCYYVYHAGQGGDSYGSTDPWDMNGNAGKVETGKWYELTYHAKVNDAGENNGVLEAWVDPLDGSGPTKAYERDNWRLRKSNGGNIGAWRHNSFFGGGWYSPQDQSLFVDNLRLYAENPL